MKNLLFVATVLISLALPKNIFGWGMTGHRVIGEIASKHVNKKTENHIKRVLGCNTLAQVSDYMDDIKSDRQERYDTLNAYHYVSIPDGMNYADANKNPKGDAIVGLRTAINLLKTGNLSPEDEAFYLKIVIHIVGDLHQPLHIGRVDDKGGNTISVSWFGRKSNLHRVWDSDIIDGKLLSYTELTALIDHATPKEVKELQAATTDDWIQEAMDLRPTIYDFEEGRSWEYKYMYVNWEILQNQLMKGGVRLAGILNDIYG